MVFHFRKAEVFDLKDIVDVRRAMFNFYKITVRTENGYKKFKLMPSFHERMLSTFKNAKSISELINKVKKEKAVANNVYNS